MNLFKKPALTERVRHAPFGLFGRFLTKGETLQAGDLFNVYDEDFAPLTWRKVLSFGGAAAFDNWFFRSETPFEVDSDGYFTKALDKVKIIPKKDFSGLTSVAPPNGLFGRFLQEGELTKKGDLLNKYGVNGGWRVCESIGFKVFFANYIFRPSHGYAYDKDKYFVYSLSPTSFVENSFQTSQSRHSSTNTALAVIVKPKVEEVFEGVKKDAYNS